MNMTTNVLIHMSNTNNTIPESSGIVTVARKGTPRNSVGIVLGWLRVLQYTIPIQLWSQVDASFAICTKAPVSKR